MKGRYSKQLQHDQNSLSQSDLFRSGLAENKAEMHGLVQSNLGGDIVLCTLLSETNFILRLTVKIGKLGGRAEVEQQPASWVGQQIAIL